LSAGSVEASYSANGITGLKACEHVRENGRWPEDVIIGEYNDLASRVLNTCDKLFPLVG
jgi:hypothetical protein